MSVTAAALHVPHLCTLSSLLWCAGRITSAAVALHRMCVQMLCMSVHARSFLLCFLCTGAVQVQVYSFLISAMRRVPHFRSCCGVPVASCLRLLRCARRLMSGAVAVRRICVCMRVCVQVLCVCACIYMCACECVQVLCMCLNMCMRVCVQVMCMCVYLYMRVCVQIVCMCVYHLYLRVCAQVLIFFFGFFFFVYTGAVQTQVYSFLISVARRVPHF